MMDASNESTIDDRPADAESPQMIPDGTIFDKYRIIRQLGRGGMSEVYLAEDLLLNQLYALKILNSFPGEENSSVAKRFFREAKCFHKLTHPNIVRVYNFGCDRVSGRLFLVMEYIDGSTLAAVKNRVYSEKELLRIARDIAGALEHLDQHGIVHRDIKPSNIMVTKNGVYKLMDLGIAKTAFPGENDYTLTIDHRVFGTPAYASAEQCQSPHNADRRSDIYSLGATLYHLACGKLPFDGKTPVETIVNVIQSTPLPLMKLRKGISAPVAKLIECMMAKSPENRPQNASVLQAMIYSIRKKRIIDLRLKAGERRRVKLKAIAVVAGIVLCALISTFILWLSKPDIREEKIISERSVEEVKVKANEETAEKKRPKTVKKVLPVAPAPVKTDPNVKKIKTAYASRILELAGDVLIHHGKIDGWRKAPVEGWYNHFGYGYQAVKIYKKPLLLLSYRASWLPDFMREKSFAKWLKDNFIMVFFDIDYRDMPSDQRRHIHMIHGLFHVGINQINTVVLSQNGVHLTTIPDFSNHQMPIYREILEDILAGKKVYFDNNNRYIRQAEAEKKL